MNSVDASHEWVLKWRPGRWLAAVLVVGWALAGWTAGGAEGGSESAAEAALSIAKVPLGLVRLNVEERWLSFPAVVNQRTGVVEYVVVTGTGKTHESVLRTEAEPQHIHIALLLLGGRPADTPLFPADLSLPPPGEQVRIEVSWSGPEGVVRRPIEDLVVTTNGWLSLPRGSWVYNGSYHSRGVFVAQKEGSIVSLQIDPSALVNNPRPGRDNDDLHFVNPAALPPDGVPVSVRIGLEPASGPGRAGGGPSGPVPAVGVTGGEKVQP